MKSLSIRFFTGAALAAFTLIALRSLVPSLASSLALAAEVNVYSHRQPNLIKPLLDEFTSQTGIKTNVLFLKKGLEERIAAEGKNSPADIIMATDISRLAAAKQRNIVEALKDMKIEANIPAQFRDSGGAWFGLTMRSRIVYASKERVAQDSITYEELADPKWRGRICIRSGQNVYNLGLFSSMIAHHGQEYTKKWLAGLRDNLARKPAGNDRAQAKSIYAGECDIGLGNSYYVGLMMTNEKKPEQKEWAASLKILFPNVSGRGSHVNISGMALAKHAPNRDAAISLMRFLSSAQAQQIYAEQVFEYPVASSSKPSALVTSFGVFKPDSLSLEKLVAHRHKASEFVDQTGFNDGPQN